MSPDPDTLARTLAFERELVASVSTRMVPFAWGTAYLNDGYRERWDSNFLWVDATAERVDAGGARRGGRARARGRRAHAPRDPDRRRRVRAIRRGGSGACRIRRGPARGDGAATGPRPAEAAVEAEEIDLAALRPALEIVLQREPWATSDEIVRMLADFRGELERHAGARFFCARVDGEIAAMCELYVRGTMAQIEDVNTLEEFRNRGLGRAVVQRAADDARDGGRGDRVPPRARRRLAQGAVREARVRSDRLRVVVRADRRPRR